MWFLNRQPRPNRAPTAPQNGSENRAHRAPPPTGERGVTGRGRDTTQPPTAPRSVSSLTVTPDRSLWAALLPAVATGWPVCIQAEGFHHDGPMDRVRLAADGSAEVRFADGARMVVPAAQRGAS
jgi:hypothetical protein